MSTCHFRSNKGLPALITSFFILLVSFGSNARSDCSDRCTMVIADGVGMTFDSALVRTTENALMQVVGTFVDTEKNVEKRREIRGVIKEESRHVEKRFSSYSQGSIRGFEVLETNEEDGLVRLTARVEVELEEFKAALRATALSEKVPIPKSLFAQAANKNRQSENLAEIIFDGQLGKIVALEHLDIEVNDVALVTDASRLASYGSMLSKEKGDTLVQIKVTASLTRDFLSAFRKTLDSVSHSSYRGSRIGAVTGSYKENFFWIAIADTKYVANGDFTENKKTWYEHLSSDAFVAVKMRVLGGGYDTTFGRSHIRNFNDTTLHIFPETLAADLCSEGVERLPTGTPNNSMGGRTVGVLAPSVELKITGANGQGIVTSLLVDRMPSRRGHVRSDIAIVVSESAYEMASTDLKSVESLRMLEYTVSGGRQCVAVVDPVKRFVIVAKLSQSQLQAAEDVSVALER